MAFFDQVRHEAEEKGEQQGANMAAIHIRIGHDDDLAVTQAIDIEVVTNVRAQRRNQRLHFLIRKDLIQAGALRIQDLPRSGRMA